MAPGLGIGLSSLTTNIGGAFSPLLIDDQFFELSGSDLQPRDTFFDASVADNNDIWDLDGNSDFMPALLPNEEGFFDVDGNGNIQPKA